MDALPLESTHGRPVSPSLLAGRRILVTDDLYFAAVDAVWTLAGAGAEVVGPFPSCAEALAGLARTEVDAAVLDIWLADGEVYPVAGELARRHVPFLFLTGYAEDIVPHEFQDAPHLLKPCSRAVLVQHVADLLQLPV
jgi:CheY-like chemotaxis protein